MSRRGWVNLALLLAALIGAAGMVRLSIVDRHACTHAGGVYVSGHCIDRKAVIEP